MQSMNPTNQKRLPPRPDLEWRADGIPRAKDVDDVYYSTSSGLQETQEVFFAGCDLPEAWSGRDLFTVAELGFGTGLNMVALAGLWAENRPSAAARLELVSFEGRPMARVEAETSLAPWRDEIGAPLECLLEQWPQRARGVQTIDLGNGVCLTLHIDEIEAGISEADFAADAWFLDGFSPAKNAEMWSQNVLNHVARLSASEARIGTYTVAGYVRRSLQEAGFDVQKKPGFAKKRERLEAIMPARCVTPQPDPYFLKSVAEKPSTVIVIGGGIMGACLARAFADRNTKVTLVERHQTIEEGTSANPLGLVMPRLDAQDNVVQRTMIDAYLRAQTYYSKFPEAVVRLSIEQPASDDRMAERFKKILADPPLDDSQLRAMDRQHGLKHLGAMVVDPVRLRTALLSGLDVRWGSVVTAIRPGKPAAVAIETGEVLEADLVIVASGAKLNDLTGSATPPIQGRAGQLEFVAKSTKADRAIASGRYAIDLNDLFVMGASFSDCADGEAPAPDPVLRQENIDALAAFWPEVVAELDVEKLQSRTGVRATTPDRLPFIGRLMEREAFDAAWRIDLEAGRSLKLCEQPIHQPGIMIAGGLGARGFTWAPLLADIAVSLAMGLPKPTCRSGLEALSPVRFHIRNCKRGVLN